MNSMTFCVSTNKKIDLSTSLLNEDVSVEGVQTPNGVVVFDTNYQIFPNISKYLSYQLRNKKISPETAGTYAKNLIYFLTYLRSRTDFKYLKSDEPFLTVQKHVIEEYLVHLANKEGLSSATIRNRDVTIHSYISNYLCEDIEARGALRSEDPYSGGLLSGGVKRKIIEACNIDELVILIEETKYERERLLLQFIFDSGARRSEIPFVTRKDIVNALKFSELSLIANKSDIPINSPYSPMLIKGSKGQNNEIKERLTLVSKATLERIIRYHASPLYKKAARKYKDLDDAPAFFNAHGGRFTKGAVSKLLERVGNRAYKKGKIKSKKAPHKLRHGFSYEILQSPDLGENYVDRLAVVQKSLGHNHLSTTEMYTRIPIEIYKSIKDKDGIVLTRAMKMERIKELTQLKIKIGDHK